MAGWCCLSIDRRPGVVVDVAWGGRGVAREPILMSV